MDLTNFQLIRKPRAPSEDSAAVAKLNGELTKRVIQLASDRETHEQAREAAREWLDQNPIDFRSANPATRSDGIEKQVFELVTQADTWLTEHGDQPMNKEFVTFRKEVFKDIDVADRDDGLKKARATLSDFITAYLVLDRERAGLALLCRWLLIADALNEALLPDATLLAAPKATYVWDWLHRRYVVANASVMALSAMMAPCVELVRNAAVADLFVVRSEWSCYHSGEIASITNTLANSTFEIENRVTREEETIETTVTERLEATEQVEEDRLQTEMSREVERAASLQVDVSGSFNVSGKYGFTEFGASASANVSASLSENIRQSNKISRDLVSKAVAKVESRIREERVRRISRKTEDLIKHVINNAGQPHLNGMYRWVDRVDRYQVFRFPDRLLLEFQIPEPAEYLRWRITEARKNDPLAVPEPPAFDVVATDISDDPASEKEYAKLGMKYRAANLPAPPDKEVSITQIVKAIYPGEIIKNDDVQWDYPKLENMADVTLPVGYVAKKVVFEGVALPFRANWRVEYRARAPVGGKNDIEGFHRITMTVVAGPKASIGHQDGNFDGDKGFTVQVEETEVDTDRSIRYFRDAILSLPPDQLVLLDPPVRDKVSVGFIAGGAANVVVTFHIHCERTDNAYAEWRNTVYDALLDAWRGWDQEWRTSQLQRRATGGPGGWDVTSSTRNKEIIRDELKRQVIVWLLNDQNFSGRDAMVDLENTWDPFDLQKAKAVAPTIQFFEQAFEWGNLTYICYPYYWARDDRWGDLTVIEAADPQFAQFLRAGSVRVVVPARPGMEVSVKHWLAYCEPFLGGPLPTPDMPEFLSIAEEIRDLTAPIAGGEPGACWEVRLGTPLLWLDPDNKLPGNVRRQLGKDPNPPDDPLCEVL